MIRFPNLNTNKPSGFIPMVSVLGFLSHGFNHLDRAIRGPSGVRFTVPRRLDGHPLLLGRGVVLTGTKAARKISPKRAAQGKRQTPGSAKRGV